VEDTLTRRDYEFSSYNKSTYNTVADLQDRQQCES